jgi:AAA+ ATPase superfamily predicted ATPase
METISYFCNCGYSNDRYKLQKMKFYDRQKETETLQKIEALTANYAQMTVITGRRRIGKTTLVKHSCTKLPFVYCFVGRKSEALLCREFTEVVSNVLDIDLGDFTSFSRLFSVLVQQSKTLNFTLVLDEFQNFRYVNSSVFSDMQNIWDSQKDESKMNLIVCGSVNTMMSRIFDDKQEPLYGRANNRIRLQPFSTSVLKEILRDFNPHYTSEDLLALYMTTGGVAKYVEEMLIHGAVTKDRMLEAFVSYGSYFIPEGREMLSDEFGKDSGNYFSILNAIADGQNTRGKIKSYTGVEPGGFLDKLENEYDLIVRYRPYLASPQSHNVKYGIKDHFLRFWFRFVQKYISAVEIGNTDYVLGKIQADYDTYSGKELEGYLRQKYAETGLYNMVTNYWERDGSNEIDLIAVDDAERHLVIGEIKRQAQRLDLKTLRAKAQDIVNSQRRRYSITFVGLSMDDM